MPIAPAVGNDALSCVSNEPALISHAAVKRVWRIGNHEGM